MPEPRSNTPIIVLGIIVIVGGIAYFALKGGGLSNSGSEKSVRPPSTPTANRVTPPELTTTAAPGTSPVTKKGEVITSAGEEARNDAIPGSPDAPRQSDPISESALPKDAIKLKITAQGISPNSFTVKAGKPVTISATADDGSTHVFAFDDASLSALAVGVAPGLTRAITFNAPDKKGEYTFRCDVPGHKARGETGKMIVK